MTSSRKYIFHNGKSGAAITVHVIARAASNEIVGLMDDGTVKIRLKTATTKADVNPALVEFLASILGASMDQIEIVAGQEGSDKLVVFMGFEPKVVQERILQYLNR